MGEAFWQHICGDITASQRPILLSLFLAGLGGSVTHCLTMCSGFVLSQVSSVATKGKLARLLLPYHAGRVTTYAGLGLAAGASFHLISTWNGFALLRHLMLGLVAILFLALFAGRLLRRLGIVLPFRLPGACDLGALKRLATTTDTGRRYLLGVSLGFLPCPLIFTALLAAATTASPLAGGVGMLLFGLGTTPALMSLSFASGNLLKTSPRLQDGLTLAALGVNGVILLALAVG
ncbi:sulfite exporter TauE/SafE family protein [Asticcacaulis sp. 201]|uniref:sulfite exporter TauE/SafE family protein n=1 Tax=Asticcacaulis sp. 201 TaxID=3028787 RepID=UPI002916D859|nr:sulfite exporter TauE/SafE family protein [Asticcacaulis sp. 201]MDV6331117.1 sulfite exporter TauE/SafE family protein [Asticcacaulis sp. 201]